MVYRIGSTSQSNEFHYNMLFKSRTDFETVLTSELFINDFDYAISILRSAFVKFKENPRIKTKLAQVYYEMGNDDMAYQFDSDYVIKMRKSNTKSSKNKSKGK